MKSFSDRGSTPLTSTTTKALCNNGHKAFCCCFHRCFPLLFPFTAPNFLDVCFHAFRAGLLHFLGNVAVNIQGEGGRVVAHVGLDSLYIVPGPEGRHRVAMAKIVEAENEAIPVEAENRTWYNPLKGYGWRHSPFLLRRSNHGTKE